MAVKKTCKSCGGTGQVSYFQGVSRFLLSTEECPECNGFGYTFVEKAKREIDAGTDEKYSAGSCGKGEE